MIDKAEATPSRARFSLSSGWGNILGRFLALIVVFAFFAIMVEDGKFYTLRNFENILRQSCVYATAGLGMTMIIGTAFLSASRLSRMISGRPPRRHSSSSPPMPCSR